MDLNPLHQRGFFFQTVPTKIKKYPRLIIPFLAMFLILILPVNMDSTIRRSLALFSCIALLWTLEPFHMVVTSLLIPVLAVILGLIKDSNPFQSFANPIIYLILSGLIMGVAFRKHELDRYIAIKILKFSRGGMKSVLFLVMVATGVLGMWMTNTGTIALLAPVILSIGNHLKKDGKDYRGMLLIAAGFSASISGLATILGGSANAITAAFLRDRMPFGFADWSVIGVPVAIILFLVAYFVIMRAYKLDNAAIDLKGLIDKKLTLTYAQKKTLFIFIPTLLLWIFGKAIFDVFPVDFYRTEVIGIAACVLLFAFNVLEWKDVREMPWEIFLLIGGGLTIGKTLIDSGATSKAAELLYPLLSTLPQILVFFLVILLAIVLSNFVNNSSTAIILVPLVMQLAPMLGMDIVILSMLVPMATAISSLTPLSVPSFALIYSTGCVTRKEMIKTGLAVAVACGSVLTVMIYLISLIH